MNSRTPPIGMIGLGDMGAPMAANIAKGGFDVLGYDKAGTTERLLAGVRGAEDINALVQQAPIVFVSVPDAKASETVTKAIAAVPSPKTEVVINLSTVGISETPAIMAPLAQSPIAYIDAPVSGGKTGAIKGTITIMWSGDRAPFEALQGVLQSFAKSVFYVGAQPGQGQALKLLNNFLSAVAMTATSEAVSFGLKHGLEMKTLLDVVNVSTGQNTASLDKFPNRILTESYDAGFRMALMQKDVALFVSEAQQMGTAASIAEVVSAYWQQGLEAYPEGDFTEIFKLIHP